MLTNRELDLARHFFYDEEINLYDEAYIKDVIYSVSTNEEEKMEFDDVGKFTNEPLVEAEKRIEDMTKQLEREFQGDIDLVEA